MISRSRLRIGGVAAGLLAAAALSFPLSGKPPTSLLPPGFGDAPAEEAPPTATQPQQPGQPPRPVATRPPLDLDLGNASDNAAELLANATEAMTPEELAEQRARYDLPPTARRSLDTIGVLTPREGGLPADAFGSRPGPYLAALMRTAKAPFASRWASILLRRALLSSTDTPAGINGADWAAERAWLLVRMGEADAARLIVQTVDADRYTPRLYAVAMQTYLASADPVGLCPLLPGAARVSDSPSWTMTDAICASFAAEQGKASAILNQAQRRGRMNGIDYRLTEKLVGAGANARRSVKIEWEGVDQLTAWRFGLATGLNVDIPEDLMRGVGPRVLAWQARAPALAIEKKQAAVETAARLGVFSGAALVDYYSRLAQSDDRPETFDATADALRDAYTARTPDARLGAMRTLWTRDGETNFVGQIASARAAAALPVFDASAEDISGLVAAMMTAGYDRSAARWARLSEPLSEVDGMRGWALLAVGSPQNVVDVPGDRIRELIDADGAAGEMLLAGLAGLGRAPEGDLAELAQASGVGLRAQTRWEQAIASAARNREKGTVALLAAIGLQVSGWSRVPPRHLYHIVAALRQVGLEPEARMIAAEAVMRS